MCWDLKTLCIQLRFLLWLRLNVECYERGWKIPAGLALISTLRFINKTMESETFYVWGLHLINPRGLFSFHPICLKSEIFSEYNQHTISQPVGLLCWEYLRYCYVCIHIINISKEKRTDRVNGSFKQYEQKQIFLITAQLQ